MQFEDKEDEQMDEIRSTGTSYDDSLVNDNSRRPAYRSPPLPPSYMTTIPLRTGCPAFSPRPHLSDRCSLLIVRNCLHKTLSSMARYLVLTLSLLAHFPNPGNTRSTVICRINNSTGAWPSGKTAGFSPLQSKVRNLSPQGAYLGPITPLL
ncbi:DNA binding [Striga asiatica]|uniref:DNA binding n=1 Tax=Striga asiatica TaxID=4170 RepID=A0A5A7R415_STRAF|nr:DNA binding [Striga asiatica]